MGHEVPIGVDKKERLAQGQDRPERVMQSILQGINLLFRLAVLAVGPDKIPSEAVKHYLLLPLTWAA